MHVHSLYEDVIFLFILIAFAALALESFFISNLNKCCASLNSKERWQQR